MANNDDAIDLMREVATLRAELDEARDLYETERRYRKSEVAKALAERDEAVAEVARLKEALEAIENATGLSPIAWTQGDILQAVMARARRALGRTDGEG